MVCRRRIAITRGSRAVCFFCVVFTLCAFGVSKADEAGPTYSVADGSGAVVSGGIPFAGASALNGGLIPRRYALVIGVNQYDPQVADFDDTDPNRKLRNLTNSAADAEKVGNALASDAKFIVSKILPTADHPLILRNDILGGISKFVSGINNSADGNRPVILLYFAGHGMHYNGKDVFAPADFKPHYESDIWEMGITIEEIQRRLTFANPAVQIIIRCLPVEHGIHGIKRWGGGK
jgi:hypothetical protein